MNNKRYLAFLGWPGLLLLGLMHAPVQAEADPPRVLKTSFEGRSFEDYARQQQQQDQLLVQQSASTLTTGSPVGNVQSGKNINPLASQAPTGKKASAQKSSTPVNINLADETSLSSSLLGVGPAKARAIVEYRQRHGRFRQPEDLLAVKGIGPATLEKNRERIRVQ